jgi:2-polyprenyl-3-methyl-5-hydroxy-6-metoxy-1,4-benzoquinol methylase
MRFVSLHRQLSSTSFFDRVGRNWVRAWDEKVTPWELGSPNPIYEELLKKQLLAVKGKRVLMPGCGSGYDAITICRLGQPASLTAIDLSPKAISTAKSHVIPSQYKDILVFQQQDFFAIDSSSCKYDVIVDYLFYSAMDISMRSQVLEQMNKLLDPNGVVATIIFPLQIKNEDETVGPPYHMNLDHYADKFQQHGFNLLRTATLDTSIAPRKNRELFAVWGRGQ